MRPLSFFSLMGLLLVMGAPVAAENPRTTIIFLHNAWPRLPWLLFGIAFSVPNVLANELIGDTRKNI